MPVGEITIQLQRWRTGDKVALEELTPLVYDHLRTLAGRFLGSDSSGAVIQPTELMDELFLELLAAKRVEVNDRNQFFAFSARVMRRILVQHARTAKAQKRGGQLPHIPLDPEIAWVGSPTDSATLDLDAALDDLEQLDEPAVRAVELRYLFSFSAEETATILGVSKATVDRHVRFALAWLSVRLHP